MPSKGPRLFNSDLPEGVFCESWCSSGLGSASFLLLDMPGGNFPLRMRCQTSHSILTSKIREYLLRNQRRAAFSDGISPALCVAVPYESSCAVSERKPVPMSWWRCNGCLCRLRIELTHFQGSPQLRPEQMRK